ncbi:hypothetical protein ACQK5W_08330 [Pantoea sp. FN060301]|uniref:hypothetical protein n=1 Tax=Pantoea sp. FN060301 TaxID=3420380 RepID=UPI003D171B10
MLNRSANLKRDLSQCSLHPLATLNESREQTEAIHAARRYAQTLEGRLASPHEGIKITPDKL